MAWNEYLSIGWNINFSGESSSYDDRSHLRDRKTALMSIKYLMNFNYRHLELIYNAEYNIINLYTKIYNIFYLQFFKYYHVSDISF